VNSQVASILKKSNEEKNNGQANSDIHGRIEYIDQGLRSVDNRIRAIEKRLSVKTFESDHVNISQDKSGNIDEELLIKLDAFDEKLQHLEKTIQDKVLAISELRGRLRLAHLNAHLKQKEILTKEQINAYNRLRGYNNN